MKESRTSKKRKRPMPGVQQMMAYPGPTIHYKGKVWRLGFNDQDAKARLEELIRSHVIRDALRTKRELGGKDGEETYAYTDKLVKKGHYRTRSEGWVDILNSEVGAILYMQSLLQKHHPDVTEDFARELLVNETEQSQAAIVAISPNFLEAVAIQTGVKPEKASLVAIAIADEMRGISRLPEKMPEPDTSTAATS